MEHTQEHGFGLEDHAWHLAQTLALQDPRIATALRNIEKRKQEALRLKTVQDLEAIAKAKAKQERKLLAKLQQSVKK